MKRWGRGEIRDHLLAQAPNWAAVVAVAEGAALQESGTTAVHSKILEWHTVEDAAAGMAVGCTGHLMVEVLGRGGWRMAEQEGERCIGRVLHGAEGGAAAAAAVVVVADGCSGSSLHYGHCS